MIFYYDNNSLQKQKDDILKELEFFKKSQNEMNEIVYKCLLNVSPSILSTDSESTKSESIIGLLESLKRILYLIKDNISLIEELIEQLSGIKIKKNQDSSEISDNLKKQLQDFNNSYNCLCEDVQTSSMDFNNLVNQYITEFTLLDSSKNSEFIESEEIEKTVSLPEKKAEIVENNTIIKAEQTSAPEVKKVDQTPAPEVKKVKQDPAPNVKKVESKSSKSEIPSITIDGISDNRVLLISESDEKVYLPYYVKDLLEILDEDTDYNNLQELIDSEYIIPLSRCNSSFSARFKETYNLMRKKEKSSVKEALGLALELSFKSSLNPAIIAACRNFNELDVYLDYLNANEVEKFNLFEIKYDFAPAKKVLV